jgi:hypothetical protein
MFSWFNGIRQPSSYLCRLRRERAHYSVRRDFRKLPRLLQNDTVQWRYFKTRRNRRFLDLFFFFLGGGGGCGNRGIPPKTVSVAPWYICKRQIHEDLGVPFFADHIRALTESFDSKSADAGNPLVWQIGRYLTEGWPKSPEAQAKGGDGQQAGRGRP